MRSIWKGTISFGLVTIPVKLYSATEQRDISFRQVHRIDGGQIKFRRVCSVCGEEVPYADVAKGYPLPTGEMVVLTDDDFADLPLATGRAIEVLQFTPADQIDPILFAKAYYLEPEAGGVGGVNGPKTSGGEPAGRPEAPGEPPPAEDLIAALRASVEAAKARDGADGADSGTARSRSKDKKGDVAATGGRR